MQKLARIEKAHVDSCKSRAVERPKNGLFGNRLSDENLWVYSKAIASKYCNVSEASRHRQTTLARFLIGDVMKISLWPLRNATSSDGRS